MRIGRESHDHTMAAALRVLSSLPRCFRAGVNAYAKMLWGVGQCDHPGCARVIWSFQPHWYGNFVASGDLVRVQLCPEHSTSLLRIPIATTGGGGDGGPDRGSFPLVSGWYVQCSTSRSPASDAARTLCMPADMYAMRRGVHLPVNATLSDWYASLLSNLVRRSHRGTRGYLGWFNLGLCLCMVLAVVTIGVWGTGSSGSDAVALIAALLLPAVCRVRTWLARWVMRWGVPMERFDVFAVSSAVAEMHWKKARGEELTAAECRWLMLGRGCGGGGGASVCCKIYDPRMFGTEVSPRTTAPATWDVTLRWTRDLSQHGQHLADVPSGFAALQQITALVRAAEHIPSGTSVAV